MDTASGAWKHEQLLEIVNPSFLALDQAQRFLYAVHADLDEVSAYAIDKQTGHITALNRQSCGGKNPVHLSIDPTGRWIITANYTAGSVGLVVLLCLYVRTHVLRRHQAHRVPWAANTRPR